MPRMTRPTSSRTRSAKPGAEQARRRSPLPRPGAPAHTAWTWRRCRAVLVGLTRIAAKRSGEVAASTVTVRPAACAKRAEHVAVAAIISAPANNDDAVRHGPAGPQIAQRGLAGALHQRVARDAERLDGMGIERAHLGGGVEATGNAMPPIILVWSPGPACRWPMTRGSNPGWIRQAAKLQLARRPGELGFDRIGVARVDIAEDEQHLLRWLDAGFHGEMDYMQPPRRDAQPARKSSSPGTIRVVSVRMDYWPAAARDADAVLGDAEQRLRVALRARTRLPQGAARGAGAARRRSSPRRSARSGTGSASTARRCSRRRWRATRASAGSASTPT